MVRIKSLQELHSLTDAEIEERFDREAPHVELSLSFIREEIQRRQQARHTRTIVGLTWAIAAMTAVNVVLFALA